MSVSTLSILDPKTLDQFVDLSSVPKHRHFQSNPIIDRLRLAAPFDYIAVSGLDVDHYRFGSGFSIDTDFPPAFTEAYAAEGLGKEDPFLHAARAATGVVIEQEVYAVKPPPQRVSYLMRTFGIYNRTLVPVMRNNIVYGAVCYTRETPFSDEEIMFLSLMAEPIHTSMTKPLMEKFATQHMKLSAGEVACLEQASLGLTSQEIAKATRYQTDTVNSYMKSAIKKLNCANRTQAIAEAIRRRLIS